MALRLEDGRWLERWVDRQICGWKMDGWMALCLEDGWNDVWMDGLICWRMDECMDNI